MSDEKPKPFAVVEEHGTGYGVSVGARYVGHWETKYVADLAAEHLCAAVEAREAKLRGALAVVVERLSTDEEMPREHRVWAACDAAKAALAGTGPDYVPRAELDAANAKLRAIQCAIDLLDARESMTRDEVCKWLEASGLKRPPEMPALTGAVRAAAVKATGSQGLALELQRRGADRMALERVMSSLAAPARQRQALTPRDGPTIPDEDRIWDSFRDGDG